MEKTSLLARIDEIIDSRSEEIAEMSDFFAANPEVSGTEFKTSAKIVDVLTKAGFDVTYPYMNIPTAFIASCKGEKEGAKAAILVEYDALPEIGHACGHNLHGSMSVLAGLALLPVMKETGGELIVVGTPAEESDGAKVAMSEQGVFDGCDFAVMLHCTCGKSIVRYRSLAMDAIEFTFKGRTAHAASAPWEGRNALNGLQLFFHAIDMLRQHVRPDARMHGIYSEAGTAPNIVPEKAVGRFYFRASKRAYLDKMLEQVYNCAKGAALFARVFEQLNLLTMPLYDATRSDIIQAVQFPDAASLVAFCRSIQKAAPVDSFVSPEPWDMPGYEDQVVMAAGAFVQGATTELSADGPIRAPYTAYLQGALTYAHARIACMLACEELIRQGF